MISIFFQVGWRSLLLFLESWLNAIR